MENKNLKSYGYLLNCPNEMLGYVNKIMNDKRTVINWNDFNVGDSFSVEENTFKCVMAYIAMKNK